MSLPPRLVVFDMDHTLTESAFLREVWETALTQMGVSGEEIEHAYLQGLGQTSMRTIKLALPDREHHWEEAAELFQSLCDQQNNLAIPGAEECLLRLKREGLLLALSTGAPPYVAQRVMKNMGWTGLMDWVYGCTPHYDKVAHIGELLKETGLSPDQVAVVGDGVGEIAAGAHHGLGWRVGVRSQNGVASERQVPILLAAGATVILDSITEVPGYLLGEK